MHCLASKVDNTFMRHNEIRDTIGKFVVDVGHDAETETSLQLFQGGNFDNRSITGKEKTRLDIEANGLWRHRFTVSFDALLGTL